MTQKVTKKDAKSYEAMLTLTGDQLLQKLRSHDIGIDPVEREDFLKFAKMDSESRKNFVQSLTGSPAPAQPDASARSAEPSGAGAGQPGSATVPPAAPSGQGPDAAAGSEMISLVEVTDLQKSLKKQRETNSRQGQQIKMMTEQLAEFQTKIKEFEKQKPSTEATVELPDMPTMPEPDKYVEGIYDEGYKAEMKKYSEQVKNFNTKFKTFVQSAKPSWVNELASELTAVKETANKASEFVSEVAHKNAETENQAAWTDLWKNVGELQKMVGLETSIPIDVINTNQLIVTSKQNHAPEEVAAAEKVIKALPAGVYDKYVKMTAIVQNLYGFDQNNKPFRLMGDLDFDLAAQSAIRKAGLGAELKAIRQVELSPAEKSARLANQQQRNDTAAAPMPASMVGASELPLSQSMTSAEKKHKLLELAKTAKENPRLYQDREWMTNFNKLRGEVVAAG